MTIVWFSRHNPTPRQLTALTSLYGPGLRIVQDRLAFDSAQDVAQRYRSSEADEMVIVAPLTVVQQLIKLGINPLWAEMRPCKFSHPEREVTITPRSGKPRHYRFIKFWRINAVTLDLTEPISLKETKNVKTHCQAP